MFNNGINKENTHSTKLLYEKRNACPPLVMKIFNLYLTDTLFIYLFLLILGYYQYLILCVII